LIWNIIMKRNYKVSLLWKWPCFVPF